MIVRDKVFVVTGAAGGIGGALVADLLSRGAEVAAIDLKEEMLQALPDRIGSANERLSLHALDVTDREAVLRLSEAVLHTHPHIDAVINCAGIVQPFVRINDLDYEAIERVMNVNFYGTLYMTKAFLPHLLERPEAYIANVSSMGGFLPVPAQSVYGASKAAVKLLTEGLYAELLQTNVHVSIVFPGAIDTNITENSGVMAPNESESRQEISMLPPAVAAKVIVDGIEKNKPQIYAGKDSRVMNLLYRLNPTFATKLIAKKMRSLLGS